MHIRIWIGLATTVAAVGPATALAAERGDAPRPGRAVERRAPAQVPVPMLPPAADRRVLRGDATSDGRSRYFASPEERQQLRRDINAAGRELYQQPRHHH